MKTPHDEKIAEAVRILRGENEPAYLPQLYETDPEPLPEDEPWPKEKPFLKPLPLPERPR